MFERFTRQARALVIDTQEQARRLGHHRIGCEHLLLAASASPTPVAQVLNALGLTPATIESAIAAQEARRPFDGIDEQALAAIGIDLDRIRASLQGTFAPQAWRRHEHERGGRRLLHRWRVLPQGHIPFSAPAKHCLERSLRVSLAAKDGYIGVEHVVLALTEIESPAVRRAFADAGTDPVVVRAAVRERSRRAG